MTVTELARRTGISRKNLDKFKNGRATGVIWATLDAICAVLDCQPGDLIRRAPALSSPAMQGTTPAETIER